LQVRTREEIKRLILARDDVKEAIAFMVKEKLNYNIGTLHIEVPEDKIYG
jgi:divalent metal cation (Fe/Co/Zn/Cd) transporter